MVRHKKRLIVLLAATLMASLALAWRWGPWRRTLSIAATASTSTESAALADPPFYRQGDERWRDDTIGGSNESLGSVGCTLCCISMALAQHGIDINPSELNRRLKEADGYTSRGWIKWETVERISAGRIRVGIPASPSHRRIQAALRAGNPVLVKIMLRSGAPHWVLMAASAGENDYLVKDPLGDGVHLSRLSNMAGEITAMRTIERISG
jgi:hypothetical protein